MPDQPRIYHFEIEEIFRTFEAKGEWRISLPAKVIIQQGFISLFVDTLGMGEIVEPRQRVRAIGKALDTLPTFLDHLVQVAQPLRAKGNENKLPNTNLIGGILVLQYIKVWANQFGCTCWPD